MSDRIKQALIWATALVLLAIVCFVGAIILERDVVRHRNPRDRCTKISYDTDKQPGKFVCP